MPHDLLNGCGKHIWKLKYLFIILKGNKQGIERKFLNLIKTSLKSLCLTPSLWGKE